MVERFCSEYKDVLKLTTLKERKLQNKTNSQLTLEKWVHDRDAIIMDIYKQLPICREHIFLVDKINLKSNSNPEVDFEVFVSFLLIWPVMKSAKEY